MKNKPIISVIMAVYNAEKYLDEAIESILNQTFKCFELIIIDDASTDNSLKIIKNYGKKDKRIKILQNKENLYAAKSRNEGLIIAKGKYIAIQDADDISFENRLKTQYEYLEKNPDVFLVGAGAINIDKNGKKIKKINPIINQQQIKTLLTKHNCIYQPTIMFRNEKIYYREKIYYSEDYDFYLFLISKNKLIANIKDPLIYYRVLETSVSRKNTVQQTLFVEKTKEFHYQRLKYGMDRYDLFDPNEILSIDIEKTTNKTILEIEIKASFRLNDFSRVRRFCWKYFKTHGFFNKIMIYFMLSFTGKKFINMVRKIIFCYLQI